jgi:hypothetical protein
MPREHRGQAVAPTNSAPPGSELPTCRSARVPGWLAGRLGLGVWACQHRPARSGHPGRVGARDSRHESRPPDLLDDRVWSLLGQDRQEAGPVEQTEAVNQAGRAVAEYGRSVQALAGNGVDQGVLGGGGSMLATQNRRDGCGAAVDREYGRRMPESGASTLEGAEVAGGETMPDVVGRDGIEPPTLRFSVAGLGVQQRASLVTVLVS